VADRRDEDEIPELSGYKAGEDEDEIPELGEYQDEPERSWLDSAGDLLLGAEEGVTLGNTRNLGRVGAGVATRVSDALLPSLERDGMAPEFVGGRGATDWLSELTEAAQRTPAGMVGRALGTGVTALAGGAAAGPTIAGQAAMGAGLGSASAAGESGGDPLAMLAGGASGAAFGLGGGVIGKGFGAVADSADDVLRIVPKPESFLRRMEPVKAGLSALARKTAQAPGAMNALAGAARGAGQFGAAGGGSLVGAVGKAQAQDVAHGSAPTLAWAVQSVLSTGSGLPPADNQRLLEAVTSGDKDALIAANFALQQRNPGYAARIQRELEGLHEED
jgi:hypothetical protein